MLTKKYLLLATLWDSVLSADISTTATQNPACGCSRNLNRDIEAAPPTLQPVSRSHVSPTDIHEQTELNSNAGDSNPMVYVEGGMLTVGLERPLIPQVGDYVMLADSAYLSPFRFLGQTC